MADFVTFPFESTELLMIVGNLTCSLKEGFIFGVLRFNVQYLSGCRMAPSTVANTLKISISATKTRRVIVKLATITLLYILLVGVSKFERC